MYYAVDHIYDMSLSYICGSCWKPEGLLNCTEANYILLLIIKLNKLMSGCFGETGCYVVMSLLFFHLFS
jgi:hypothetical protein